MLSKKTFLILFCLLFSASILSIQAFATIPKHQSSSGSKQLLKEVSDLSKKVQDIDGYLGLFTRQEMDNVYILHSANAYKESALFETETKVFQDDPEKLRQICQAEADHGQSRDTVGSAYYCLAKLSYQEESPTSFYKTIEYLSYSLEAHYEEKHAQFLEKIIAEQELSSPIVGTSKEIAWLKTLLKNQDPKTRRNAATRLSMIYRLGRVSYLEERSPPNVYQAIAMKKAALSNLTLEKTPIHLLFVIDDKYAPHAAVTLLSALLSSNPETHYIVHFLLDPDKPLSPDVQQKLSEIKKILPFDISFDIIPDNVLPSVLKKRFETSEWPKIVWYRLFAPWALTNIERAVYLDGDLIVKRDVGRLIDRDLLRPYDFFTGVLNLTFSALTCKQYTFESYINSGVLGFNMQALRQSPTAYDTLKEILEINTEDPNICDLSTPDQNAISFAYSNRIHAVSRRWNWPAGFLYNTPESHMTFLEYITHFISPAPNSPLKPWDQDGAQEAWAHKEYDKIHPLYWDYWAYREVTPWKPKP